MFLGLLVVLIGLGFFAARPFFAGGDIDIRFVALAALPVAGASVVVVQWLRHPDAIKDWFQGGFVDIVRDDEGRLEWIDWAMAITRAGALDRRAGFLRLERRVLFGLIPISTVERKASDFYRVEVAAELIERSERRRGFFTTRHEQVPVRYDYTVELVDRQAKRLLVLDLSTRIHDQRGERFIARLRERLEAIVGSPGGTGAQAWAKKPRAEEPPPDDFEAWRAKGGR